MKNLRYLCLLCALAVCTMLPTGCIERPDEVPGPDDTAQGGNKYDYATTRDIPLNLDYARRGSKALFERVVGEIDKDLTRHTVEDIARTLGA